MGISLELNNFGLVDELGNKIRLGGTKAPMTRDALIHDASGVMAPAHLFATI